MLLLFDIDGTLIRVAGAGRRALVRAFQVVANIEDAMRDVRLDGRTDLSLIDEAFRLHLGRPPDNDAEITRVIDQYLVFLDEELKIHAEKYHVFPGAVQIARAASDSGFCAVGLATGNLERGARMKLERAELNSAFAFGGFGCDSKLRPELVARGIERGQAHALQKFGRVFEKHEIFVIGDTELDVAAARAVGVVAVGVLAGSAKKELLEQSSPDLLVDSLESAALWERIGLSLGAKR